MAYLFALVAIVLLVDFIVEGLWRKRTPLLTAGLVWVLEWNDSRRQPTQ